MRIAAGFAVMMFCLAMALGATGQQVPGTSFGACAGCVGCLPCGYGVVAPKLVASVEPEFSEKARKKKLSGHCTVAMVVNVDGHVSTIRVVHSIAEEYPPKLRAAAVSLDEKAIEAVRQYRFEPAMFHGSAVPVALTVDVNFSCFDRLQIVEAATRIPFGNDKQECLLGVL